MKNLFIVSIVAFTLAACSAIPENNISALDVTFDQANSTYKLNWLATDNTQTVEVLVASDISEISGKNHKVVAEITGNQFQWPKQGAHQRKYFTIRPKNGTQASSASRLLPLEKGRNFRDLGGYQTTDGKTVKLGKLFRSGILSNLTDNDYNYIADLGIKSVVDFRDQNERASEVTQWKAGDMTLIYEDYSQVVDMQEFAKVLMDPSLNQQKAERLFAKMYPEIVKQQTQNYSQMFDQLASTGEPLLFHCTAGKDRTGVAGVLILTALGVDKETAIKDYLLSEQYLDPNELFHAPEDMDPEQQKMYAFFSKLPKDVVKVFAGVRRPMIEEAIAYMETTSGSVLNYIQQELKVSDDELQQIRKYYLN